MNYPKNAHFVDNYLSALLARASHLISAEFHAVVQQHGLSVAEWRVMASLADGPAMSTGQLAHITLTKQPTLTRLLDRMEAAAYVQRSTDANDRRITLVQITTSGSRTVAQLMQLAQEHEQRVLQPFGLERAEALKDMLRHIIRLHGSVTSGSNSGK